MRNSTRRYRMALLLVGSLTAVAQPPAEDPMDVAIRAAYLAAYSGDSSRFVEAAATRDKARALLQREPASSARFAGWTDEVAQLFRNAGRNAEARAVLEDGLARSTPFGKSHPARIAMLNALAGFWESDGNLLKGLGYLEQAAAARASAPTVTAEQRAVFNSGINYRRFVDSPIQTYIHLATLYQKLGRPEAVAAIAVKIRALGSTDELALAGFYEQLGQFEDAAAVYRKMAEQATDPQTKANAWVNLATLAARQEHFPDAVAATEEAIAVAQSSEASGIVGQTIWMRQNLASYQRSAGLADRADQTYRQLVQQSRGGPQEIQSLLAYASYLGGTGRATQAENLLKDYLADNPNPGAQQQTNFLNTLANLARGRGDSKSADRYQQEAQALQPPPPPPPAGQIRTTEKLQEAETAAGAGRSADAYSLAVDALDSALQASDGRSIGWMVPQIASMLASNKESAKAEQVYRRLFAVADMWKVDTMGPLLEAARRYVPYLWNQPERLGEIPAAIEQFRRLLVEANGPDSGTLAEPLRMSVEFARTQWPRAEASARELLELQESLSGNTSEPYLADLQIAARLYQAAGDYASALPLFRKTIVLADLQAPPNNDWQRSRTRMDTAFDLARMGQFDEAETLGEEAVAMRPTVRAPRANLERQLAQIRQMKERAVQR